MKTILSFFGTWIYAVIVAFIVSVIFVYLTPWVVCFGWIGFFAFFFVGATFIKFIISSLQAILLFPIVNFISICSATKWVVALTFAIFGVYCIRLPWILNGQGYGVRQVILAISMTSIIGGVYFSLIYAVLAFNKDRFDAVNRFTNY